MSDEEQKPQEKTSFPARASLHGAAVLGPGMLAALYPATFGVLALGMFVGFLLGLGLEHSGKNLKSVLTVLGAALGGGPILFMEGLGQEMKYGPTLSVLLLPWGGSVFQRRERL